MLFYVLLQVDNGYDVVNYIVIDFFYGIMVDFDVLVVEVKVCGICIVLDMVLNYMLIEYEWFCQLLNKESFYCQFYIWCDGELDVLLNNWCFKFGGNVWQWYVDSGQYYLYLFVIEQVDFNWENLVVCVELKKVCEFWVDCGVDGLCFDVVNLILKDQIFFCDLDGDGCCFYIDGLWVYEFLQEMSCDVFILCNLMIVGEMFFILLEYCQQYVVLDGCELLMIFNFYYLKVDYFGGEKWIFVCLDYVVLKVLFCYWQWGMYNWVWNVLFWCNYDQLCIVLCFGDEGEYWVMVVKMLVMVLYGMQGMFYIYQGEEIGMINLYFSSISDYCDVESYNMFIECVVQG